MTNWKVGDRLIEVVFSRARGRYMPMSRLICVLEGTNYSHVSVRLNQSHIFETTGTGCHLLLNEAWQKKHIEVAAFKYCQTSLEEQDLDQFIDRQLGRPYGFLAFLSLGLKRLGIPSPRSWQKQYVCSSLVAAALGLPNAYSLDPKALWDYLQSHEEC